MMAACVCSIDSIGGRQMTSRQQRSPSYSCGNIRRVAVEAISFVDAVRFSSNCLESGVITIYVYV